MNIGIVSGYFAEAFVCGYLHEGHKEYLKTARKNCDYLIVLIDCKSNFEDKYNFVPDYNVITELIKHEVDCEVVVSEEPTYRQLHDIRRMYPVSTITFMKGGDRDWNNLPPEEIAILKTDEIKFKKLEGDKLCSASEEIKGWKKTYWGWEHEINKTTKMLHAILPLSIQYHENKTESWWVVSDEAYIIWNGMFRVLHKNDVLLINPHDIHCLLKGTVYEVADREDGTIRKYDWERNR